MKEQKWQFVYINGVGEEKVVFPKSKEQVDLNRRICKERGLKVVSVKKLYPFSTAKNQHNFELINNICYNAMWDMDHDEAPYNAEEYERLGNLRERAERYFLKPLPIAWVTWEEHQDMAELANMAIMHRQDACIANGRPELVPHC